MGRLFAKSKRNDAYEYFQAVHEALGSDFAGSGHRCEAEEPGALLEAS